MTTEQAVAILQAERVLQGVEIVGNNGPDVNTGSAWYNYVMEAGAIIDDIILDYFADIHILET